MDNGNTKPLEDENVVERILELYIKYNFLTNVIPNMSIKSSTPESIIYKDVFYKTIFEEWQKYILNYDTKDLPKEQQQEINYLKDYLKDIRVRNGKDVINYSDPNKIENEELKKALIKYSWKETIDNNYYSVSSQSIDNDKKKQNIYNLYINCETNKLHQILLEFVKKCKEKGLEYYFEFNEHEHRDDILIIKSNEENLKEYISILKEIIKNNNLEKNIFDIPIFSSPIDSKIGYTINSDTTKSFIERRINHLNECIKEETINYIINELYKEIILPSGRKVLYKELLIKNLAFIEQDNLINNPNINIPEKERKSREFTLLLEKEIGKKFNTIMDALYSNDKNLKIEIQVNKIKIIITYNDIKKLLKNQTYYMNNNYKKFKVSLIKRIKLTSSSYGIDSNNYAFDIMNPNKKDDKKSSNIINDLTPTENIEIKSSYKTSKESKKEGIILENNHKPRSIEKIIEDIKSNISKL